MAVAVWSPRQRYYGKSGPLQGTASWHESYGPREQAETHATPYFIPLSISEKFVQKGGGLCGPPKVTRNFESVLVIDDAPIRHHRMGRLDGTAVELNAASNTVIFRA